MSNADEINMLLEQLTAAWGNVVIHCNGKTCTVTEINLDRTVEAPTLLEALRLAAALVDEGEGKP